VGKRLSQRPVKALLGDGELDDLQTLLSNGSSVLARASGKKYRSGNCMRSWSYDGWSHVRKVLKFRGRRTIIMFCMRVLLGTGVRSGLGYSGMSGRKESSNG